jgi:hypothetical protein
MKLDLSKLIKKKGNMLVEFG